MTGSVGFIGFHVSLFLQKKGHKVIGYDNFNSYYSTALKEKRALLLKQCGIVVIRGDIREKEALKKIIQEQQITHIVHLAAQAGIRHSLECPEDYVAANLDGFVAVLEACRAFPEVKLLFASSSSVYGTNTKIPFSEEDVTDHPANLYGASKKSDELLAYSYHHLFGIEMVGLRYFTVYGPWGRPDMAYFSFANAILEGKPLKLFNHGKMRRDFTYIDDIVEGSFAALQSIKGFDIFNLGNNSPVELLTLVSLLEKNLGKKAKVELLPMQKGEIIETYADITKAQKKLGFQPKTTIDEGICNFVSWYKENQP